MGLRFGVLGWLVLSVGIAVAQKNPPAAMPKPRSAEVIVYGAATPGPTAPEPKPAADGAYFPGPLVTAPQLVKLMAAGYPYGVKASRIAGFTALTMIVGVDGKATAMEVVKSHGESFDASAMNAVELSRFAPGGLHGKAVPVRIDVLVPFHEDGKQAVPQVVIAERDLPLPEPLPQGEKPPSYTPPIPIHVADANFTDPNSKNPYPAVSIVTVLVNTDGTPGEVRVVKGQGFGMDEEAVAAVKKYRFVPATNKGKTVAARRNLEVKFSLF